MTVPAHNLYDFIHQVTENRFWLMYFYPWGSKNLSNLIDYIGDIDMLNSASGIPETGRVAVKILPDTFQDFRWTKALQPVVLCHDQEPLNYDLYQVGSEYFDKCEHLPISPKNIDLNLRYKCSESWQKYWILLHSEINSQQLAKYESTGRYLGAYWWSHAVIARDWYRYAEHDCRLSDHDTTSCVFLIYCRDTNGSRQYRTRFLASIDGNLANHCQIGSFLDQHTTSDSSAEYNVHDFTHSMISVVLETVFDDNRIHLTEKTLRPIACGHPFILAAGPGSLSILRHYGFQTFSPWIDESYDNITDPDQRLACILKEMHRLVNLPAHDLQNVIDRCREISNHNKAVFFSDAFFAQVIGELIENIQRANCKANNQLDPTPWIHDYFLQENTTQLPAGLATLVNSLLEQDQGHDHGLDDKSRTNGHDV
jgi:hypothetical protein